MHADISKTGKLFTATVFLFAFLVGANRIWEPDAWWHLKAGQVISETGRLKGGDVFSHTNHGAEWVNDEWLGDVYLYGIYKRHGFAGIIFAAALAGALIFSFSMGVCRMRGSPAAAAAAVLCVAAIAARMRITPRPDVFALLFFSADIYLLNRLLRAEPGDKKARSLSRLIPVIQVMWVNFHPSGIAGAALAALALLSCAAAYLLNKMKRGTVFSAAPQADPAAVKHLCVILAATVAASLINPYFLHALTAPFEFSANKTYLSHIAEWAPIPRGELLSLAGDPQTICFKTLAALGFIAMASRPRRINIFDAALFTGCFIMALTSRRFIGMFAIAAAPCVTGNLSFWTEAIKPSERVKAACRAGALIFIAAIFLHQTRTDPRFTIGTGVKRHVFPENAVKFLKANKIDGAMYNDYGIGGYLIWNCYPRNKVFIDGRTTFYGADFYNSYIAFESAPTPQGWREIESKYGIDYAVLSVPQRSVRDAIVHSSPAWRTVFWDSRSIALVKESARFSDIIKRNGYAVTEPYTVMNLPPAWEALSPETRKVAIGELERNISQSDFSILALRALAYIYYKEGDKKRALDLALRGVALNPRLATLQAIAGQIYLETGDRANAVQRFKAAAAVDGKYEMILKQIRER